MKISALIVLSISSLVLNAQKEVTSYPIRLGYGTFIAPRDLESYFLQDPITKQFMLVMTNNKEIKYVLFDSNLNMIDEFSPDALENTVFHFDRQEYLGGVAKKGKFYFIYKVKDKRFLGSDYYYQLETVDAVNKTISDRPLTEIPENEKMLLSFGDFDNYFSITADNTNSELKFYGLNAEGQSFIKVVKVEIPKTSSKKTLTDYLQGMQYVRVGEEERSGPDVAAAKVKLFYSREAIKILVNEKDNSTHVITVRTDNFACNQKEIGHSGVIDKEGNDINSFLLGNRMYSLLYNTKNIRVAVYDAETGQLLRLHEINEKTDFDLFANNPATVNRSITTSIKKIHDSKKLIRSLGNAPNGILAYPGKNGNTVITVCNYHMVTVSSGSSVTASNAYAPGAIPEHNRGSGVGMYTRSVIVPGQMYSSTSDIYYNTTDFKLLMEAATLNLTTGVANDLKYDQIKDYIRGRTLRVDATNQFTVNGTEYYGYYNRWKKSYIIEEILIKQ